MATIEEFILKFKTQGAEQITAASNGIKSLGKEVSSLASSGGGLQGVLSGIAGKMGPLATGGLAVAGAFAAAGLKAIDMADALADISDASGVSAGALNNLKNSLTLAGGKADDFANLATRLNKNVGEAASGNENLQKTFKTLGVYVTDSNGKLRDTGDILRDAIARLAGIEDPATRAKLAVELFGKEAAKLDFTKLNAANDPFKDEQIKQLAKYRDAIDAIGNSASNSLLTIFGKLAIAIDEASLKAQKAEAEANARGNTRNPNPGAIGVSAAVVNPFGVGGAPAGERQMTDKEKAKFDLAKKLAEAYKDQGREMRKLEGLGKTEAGGFGGPSEATLKAAAESEKRLKQSTIDVNKNLALRGANEIQTIEINAAAEIAKARETVFSQERLSDGQKAAEFAAKKLEIESKATNDIAKVRTQTNAKIFSEEEAQRQASAEAIAAQEKGFADAAKNAYNQVEAYKEVTGQLQEQILLEDIIRGSTEIQAKMYQKVAEETRRRTDALKALEKIENLSHEERKRREQEIVEDSKRAIQTIYDRTAVETERQTSFADGWDQAFKKYAEDARNVSRQASDYFNIFARGFENVFVNMTKGFPGVKAAFKDLINNMITEFLKLQAQKAFLSLFGGGGVLSSFFGGGGFLNGNGGMELAGSLGFANGGNPPVGKFSVVGERGPELFLPRTPGTIIPNHMLGGGGNVTNINYTIQAVDASSFRSLVARDPEFIYSVTEAGRRSQPTRRLS